MYVYMCVCHIFLNSIFEMLASKESQKMYSSNPENKQKKKDLNYLPGLVYKNERNIWMIWNGIVWHGLRGRVRIKIKESKKK